MKSYESHCLSSKYYAPLDFWGPDLTKVADHTYVVLHESQGESPDAHLAHALSYAAAAAAAAACGLLKPQAGQSRHTFPYIRPSKKNVFLKRLNPQ